MKGRVGGEGARDVGPIREGFRQSLFQPDGPSPDGSGVGGNGKLIERKREDARSALRLATGSDKEGVIKSRGCPHRLVAQDVALSRPKPEFESPWGHCAPRANRQAPPHPGLICFNPGTWRSSGVVLETCARLAASCSGRQGLILRCGLPWLAAGAWGGTSAACWHGLGTK